MLAAASKSSADCLSLNSHAHAHVSAKVICSMTQHMYGARHCGVGRLMVRSASIYNFGLFSSRCTAHFNPLPTDHGLSLLASIIDSDYRGELKVIINNHSDDAFTIKHGDRIAQIVVIKHESPEIEVVTALTPSERNTNGLGSTGLR
jgi:dUTPase